MSTLSKNSIAILAAIVAMAVGIALYLAFSRVHQDSGPIVASESVTANYFTSLAALDVEENQLAVQTLSETVKHTTNEPALFANLALAQVRVGEIEAASKSIEEALRLPQANDEVKLIYAEILGQSGKLEASIEQLQAIRKTRPENILLTYSIIKMLSNLQSENSDKLCLQYIGEIVQSQPNNILALTQQGRFAATLREKATLKSAISHLEINSSEWPQQARDQLAKSTVAADQEDYVQAALDLASFENLMVRVPAFQTARQQLEGESTSIGVPVRNLLRLSIPPSDIERADAKLSFDIQSSEQAKGQGPVDLLVAFAESGGAKQDITWAAVDGSLHSNRSDTVKFPGDTSSLTNAAVQMMDLNWDLKQDLVVCGSEGCFVYLQQDQTFVRHPIAASQFAAPCRASWPFDVDADGDLDLLLSDFKSPLHCFINDGQANFTLLENFVSVPAVQQTQVFDVDSDGDVDLVTLNVDGEIVVCMNERNSQFALQPIKANSKCVSISSACLANGTQIELLAFLDTRAVDLIRYGADSQWKSSELVKWPSLQNPIDADEYASCGLFAEDLDNNGAVDLIASARGKFQVWLAEPGSTWLPLESAFDMRVDGVLDIDRDGMLDLVGIQSNKGSIATTRGEANYQWQEIELHANPNAGDKRINSVGLFGRVELRSGYQLQIHSIDSPRVHFGIGKHSIAQVARIVWPNGTSQSEFALAAREDIVAAQRLKGSCPWVFAFNGDKFQFTKDFLWRSPLGLRLNAQETAGVTQTEDWIRIAGDQLRDDSGKYKFRISAELWETHFIDYLDLAVVDHPADTSFYIDERFNPRKPQSQEKYLMNKPRSLANVRDDMGMELDAMVEKIDGQYADSFALGPYQGLAESHSVIFELPRDIDLNAEVVIVGHAWLYPTDSSVNVAISQRKDLSLYGLILEQPDESGNWVVIDDNLGFPGGKNKDMVLPLHKYKIDPTRPLRLRTNMEVYWDYLAWAYLRTDVSPKVTNVSLAKAELRYRGYSKIQPVNRRRPDTPFYQVEATSQRWLDLEGLYTRFGPVKELLNGTDDRFVIMNAGDELAIEFDSLPPPAEGMTRDFILIGDGWVKDGDLNTAFSRTVLPLPTHQSSDYGGTLLPLNQDPIYLKHREDWERYHTRYVSPRTFQNKLTSKSQKNSDEVSK